jgi:hypothetical protein
VASVTDVAEGAPDAETTFRCSPWTRATGVDPIGSAGRLDRLLLVEWPLPWPSDVSEVPALAGAATDPRARLMTVVPHADEPEHEGLVRVVHHRRAATHRLVGTDHLVERGAVPQLLVDLLDAPAGDDRDWSSAVGPAPREVLVCGHGRRDPCCGRWGTLLHAELASRQPDVRVWRCSHTGGHRFAPTAISLPEGRAWAYADADLLSAVIDRRGDVSALAGHDRGSFTFDPWAQTVERELFTQRGWAWLESDVTEVRTAVEPDGRSASVVMGWTTLDGAAGQARAEVEVARVLPVLVCGEPPEAATKVSPEYRLRRLRVG